METIPRLKTKLRSDIVSVPVFLSYIDYCRVRHKDATLKELHQWKKKFNHR
jgi:hypothetical protein